MIYLTKHLTEAAYDAAKDNLAKPHVALTADDNKVHYMPNATPPTPQSCITAITVYEESVETPFCGDGYPTLYFSRPVSFNELQNLEIEACYCYEHEEGIEPIRLLPDVHEDYIVFKGKDGRYYYMTVYKPEESTINSIELITDDNEYWYNRIYLQ